MDSKEQFDFWYALNHSEVLVRPEQKLESFGTTSVHYHLVTELMDATDQVRVREGKIHAFRPQIVTPTSVMESLLEGFEEQQADAYLEWLRANEQELRILKYGFKIRKEAIQTTVVNDRMELVIDKLRDEIKTRGGGLQALIRGVEEPWEVCLIKLMTELVQRSAGLNARELGRDPEGHRHEIELAFVAAMRDRSKIQALANLLHQRDLFAEYEDRFYSLVRGR
jgi:hypothetical protein